jgi:outer membrane protein OmpA-like peptidoglycan-associated protein
MAAETDRWTGGLSGRAGAWLAAGLALSLLAGCTVFAEEEPEPATIQADTDESQFPAVGEVPDAAPETTTAEERQVIIEQLEADQAAAADPYATQSSEFAPVEPSVEPSAAPASPSATPSASATMPVAAADTQGFAYTSIQTPPPSGAVTTSAGMTSTGSTGASSIASAPAAPLPAPQPLPAVQPYYGAQTSAGGQVIVDYSVLGGGAGTPYGQTGYYGYGAAGQPVALIYFQHGSAALSSDDRNVITEVAELQKARGGVIQIVGHASMRTGNVDPAAHERANYEMSLARANAVADALVRAGVRAENVQVAAAGSSEPEYYEFMPTGEAGNRRAEIYLVY